MKTVDAAEVCLSLVTGGTLVWKVTTVCPGT